MKTLLRLLDATIGKLIRHIFFVLVGAYYRLFFNVSCSNKHMLQDLPGGLILATHVSRHDGPLLSVVLYTTMRVRSAVGYQEFQNWFQWFPLVLTGAIRMSSPRSWPAERRQSQKSKTMRVLRRVIENGHLVLLFPSGRVKRQAREIIKPDLSGAYETLKAVPGCPVVLLWIDGLSPFDEERHDRFWTFIGIKKGRRHVNIRIELLEGVLDTSVPLDEFNARLEDLLNRKPEGLSA